MLMDEAGFTGLLDKARLGKTEDVLKVVKDQKGLVLRSGIGGGWRLLDRSAIDGHLELTRGLLDLGAVVDARTIDGYDALMYASRNGHEAVVTLLLARGANANSRSPRFTALNLAAWKDNLPICLILLAHGADLLARNWQDKNALELYGIWAEPEQLDDNTKQARRAILSSAFASGPYPK